MSHDVQPADWAAVELGRQRHCDVCGQPIIRVSGRQWIHDDDTIAAAIARHPAGKHR